MGIFSILIWPWTNYKIKQAHRERKRAYSREYYYRVTKPKKEAEKMQTELPMAAPQNTQKVLR